MIGAGKYDDVLTKARTEAKAEGAVLIVLNGEYGNGFCAQVPSWAIEQLPGILRQMANDMEADAKHQSLVAGVSGNPNRQ